MHPWELVMIQISLLEFILWQHCAVHFTVITSFISPTAILYQDTLKKLSVLGDENRKDKKNDKRRKKEGDQRKGRVKILFISLRCPYNQCLQSLLPKEMLETGWPGRQTVMGAVLAAALESEGPGCELSYPLASWVLGRRTVFLDALPACWVLRVSPLGWPPLYPRAGDGPQRVPIQTTKFCSSEPRGAGCSMFCKQRECCLFL